MAEEKKTILLNGGREVNVTLVTKAHEFLAQLLGDASTKSGLATLRVVKNTAGKPFVAVLIGGKHVGFLSDPDAQELFPTLADCERDGVVAQAKGRMSAPPGSSEQPVLTLSLPVPGQSFSAVSALEAKVPSAVIEPPMSQPMPNQNCRSCGKALPPDAKFCLGCGTHLYLRHQHLRKGQQYQRQFCLLRRELLSRCRGGLSSRVPFSGSWGFGLAACSLPS